MTLESRFWQKVDRDGADDCWLWRGATSDGYGVIVGRDRRRKRAHRVSYELHVGPIPNGLVLDHLCRNRRCVNPKHLEVVTHRTNILRGEGVAARYATATHCKHGHEFTPENTYRYLDGKRTCRACNAAIARRAYGAKRGDDSRQERAYDLASAPTSLQGDEK